MTALKSCIYNICCTQPTHQYFPSMIWFENEEWRQERGVIHTNIYIKVSDHEEVFQIDSVIYTLSFGQNRFLRCIRLSIKTTLEKCNENIENKIHKYRFDKLWIRFYSSTQLRRVTHVYVVFVKFRLRIKLTRPNVSGTGPYKTTSCIMFEHYFCCGWCTVMFTTC